MRPRRAFKASEHLKDEAAILSFRRAAESFGDRAFAERAEREIEAARAARARADAAGDPAAAAAPVATKGGIAAAVRALFRRLRQLRRLGRRRSPPALPAARTALETEIFDAPPERL